jgi:UDP-hydrolysing UDP-N-acetyl-D-glucosamine 2-epimerase
MKKILAFTAIRSEYDLLSSLYKLLDADKDIELKLIVSGTHLSTSYGYSVEDIESDGLAILAKIETLINSNIKNTRIKSASILLQKAIDIVYQYNPDIIIYAGDREEVIMASLIGGYLEIPTIHFFGGDHVEDSHIDNPIRHATSKLSTIHMVSTQEHQNRLIRMGEEKNRIYNIGSVALDKFINQPVKDKSFLKQYFKIESMFDTFALLIFHPIPKERDNLSTIFENILKSLQKNNINTFVSYPNIDQGNMEIINIIEKYKKNKNFVFYKTLPREIFLTIYKNADLIVGNSSSGILESASIPIAAINVGLRQRGRRANDNVIFSDTDIQSIEKSIKIAFSKKFQEIVKNTKNIYGDGKSSKRAFDIIKANDFKELIFKDKDILEL